MSHIKYLSVAAAALLLTACQGPQSDVDNALENDNYLAVYREIETGTDTDTDERAELPAAYSYSYLDHISFIGDSICGGISEHGLLSDLQVVSSEYITSEKLNIKINIGDETTTSLDMLEAADAPYIYMWLGGKEIFTETDSSVYADKIIYAAQKLRTRFPDSMVIILSVSPVSEKKGGSEQIKEYNSAVKSALYESKLSFIEYFDTWDVLADMDGYLKEAYDRGDGVQLNRAGFRKLLSSIEENRFYSSLANDMKYLYSYKDLYIVRDEYDVTDGKVCYLTFDDGPSKHTPQILDILEKNDIKATFFITGWCIDGKEDILTAVSEAGHTIGLHSYSHDYDEIYKSTEDFLADFSKVYNIVYDITGKKPWAFRFPGGSYNNFNKDTADDIIAEMSRRGFTYYDWNAATSDATTSATYDSCMENLRDSLNADHEVVLMHDSLELTEEYLQEAIDIIRDEGYSFETIDSADPVHF